MLEWGVQPHSSTDQAQHFRLTNLLLIGLFFGSVIETVVCFASGAYEAALLNSTAPFVFAAGLALMKFGYTVTARVFVLLICNVAGYAFACSLGPESYFQFIFLFASAFSVVFFSVEETVPLLFALLAPLITFSTLEFNHFEPIFGMSRAPLNTTTLARMRVTSMAAIWLLMIFHFFYFMRDRRRSRVQLVSSAKMVATGRMAAGIAHEVNNPLQLIVSHAEKLKKIARSETLTQEQICNISDQIQSVAMRIASINKGLLSLARDASGDPLLKVPLHAIVKLSLDFSRARLESQNVEVSLSDIPLEWNVIGRETQLAEVILNVLNNAYDAVVDSQIKHVQIIASADKSWVELAISDSGSGVSEKLRQRIFDPFFTTKPIGKGTGLGLSISQAIMSVHGGKIYYAPVSTGGKFVIRIPRGPDDSRRSIDDLTSCKAHQVF
jgi:signal transduction histidine kinase